MGGSSTPTTQKTTTEMSPEQRELMRLAMPGVQSFAASVPKRYAGSTVAGFDPSQVAGQEMALGAAGEQGAIANAATARSNFFTGGDIWQPQNNPALTGAVDAATRPITEALTERQLPAIRGEAVTTGNFGSSRQGIAEGMASREASRAIGDTSAKLVNQAYDTNINAQLKAMAMTPMLQQAQLAPAVTTSGVGDVRQALEQAMLNSNVSGFNYDQLAPFLQSKELMSLITGIPGGTTTATGSTPGTNKAMSALGGAAAGASLGTAIMPGIGTGIGAAGGALLPFLFS